MGAKRTKAAFCWIINILQKNDIPFQIGGGFAAHVYGSNRAVADIDIAIPESKFHTILPETESYLTYSPAHYVDQNWNLDLMTLVYKGQEIDIAGAQNKKYFNKTTKKWVRFPSDFSSSQYKFVYGLRVPLMNKEKLIKYKKMIGRKVDIIDVKALSK